jgi:hypothetical protein
VLPCVRRRSIRTSSGEEQKYIASVRSYDAVDRARGAGVQPGILVGANHLGEGEPFLDVLTHPPGEHPSVGDITFSDICHLLLSFAAVTVRMNRLTSRADSVTAHGFGQVGSSTQKRAWQSIAIRPAQRGQRRTSRSKGRRISAAHVQSRGLTAPAARSGPTHRRARLRPRPVSARRYATTSGRQCACGASSPCRAIEMAAAIAPVRVPKTACSPASSRPCATYPCLHPSSRLPCPCREHGARACSRLAFSEEQSVHARR